MHKMTQKAFDRKYAHRPTIRKAIKRQMGIARSHGLSAEDVLTYLLAGLDALEYSPSKFEEKRRDKQRQHADEYFGRIDEPNEAEWF